MIKIKLNKNDINAISNFFGEWIIDNESYDFDEDIELKKALIKLGVLDSDD